MKSILFIELLVHIHAYKCICTLCDLHFLVGILEKIVGESLLAILVVLIFKECSIFNFLTSI